METQLLRKKCFKQGLQFLNENIGTEKLNTFQKSEVWTGNAEDTSLYILWKKTQIELEKDSTPTEQSLNNHVILTMPLLEHENAPAEQPEKDDTIPAILLCDNNNRSVEQPSSNVTPLAVLLQNDVAVQAAVLPQSSNTSSSVVPPAGPSYGIRSPFKRHSYYPSVEKKQKENDKRKNAFCCLRKTLSRVLRKEDEKNRKDGTIEKRAGYRKAPEERRKGKGQTRKGISTEIEKSKESITIFV